MPIENLNQNQGQSIAKKHDTLFNDKNIIVAGTLKVRHLLLPEPILLYGFIVEDYFFNSEDFKIVGLKISYHVVDDEYISHHNKIYPRIKINLSQEKFPYDNDLYINTRKAHKTYHSGYAKKDEVYKYYLFNDNFSEIPDSVANNIFVVCKYRENNAFKYMICSLHELVPIFE